MSASGKVSVAASEGAARFAAKGKEVLVSGGTVSTAMPDEAPSDPEPMPQEILLSVVWPEDDRLGAQARVKGKAQSSSRINVNGLDAEVRADGTFQTSVPLRIGKNRS